MDVHDTITASSPTFRVGYLCRFRKHNRSAEGIVFKIIGQLHRKEQTNAKGAAETAAKQKNMPKGLALKHNRVM